MKRERNIITIDEYGKVTMPTDTGETAMTEWELCNLFGIIAPILRAGIKALCKSGVLGEDKIKRTVRISDKCSMDVYNLEAIIALSFRIGTCGAERVRKILLDRIMHERTAKTSIFFSLFNGG